MPFRKLRSFCLLTVLIISAATFANEKKEGEGAAEPEAVPRDQKEFTEKNSKINSLASRIAEAEHHFAELVKEKNESKDSSRKAAIIKEMVEVTNQRNKDVETYNRLKDEVDLRYPNQGEHLNRRYQTQEKRSLEELEGVAGLDELLTRTKKVVEKKFAPLVKDDPALAATQKRKTSRKKAGHQPAASEEEERPRLRLEK